MGERKLLKACILSAAANAHLRSRLSDDSGAVYCTGHRKPHTLSSYFFVWKNPAILEDPMVNCSCVHRSYTSVQQILHIYGGEQTFGVGKRYLRILATLCPSFEVKLERMRCG